jgi:hypothetical protein
VRSIYQVSENDEATHQHASTGACPLIPVSERGEALPSATSEVESRTGTWRERRIISGKSAGGMAQMDELMEFRHAGYPLTPSPASCSGQSVPP